MAKHVTFCTWDDAPHLSEAMKASMFAALPSHQRDARARGVPQLGAGAIYPVPETEIKCARFPIPDFWPRAFGMDVGWRWTAGIWEAMDVESQVRYIYRVYKAGHAEPSIHAAAFRGPHARDAWIPGDIDPAAQGRTQDDGEQLIEQYKSLGLNLEAAPHAVESGLYDTFNLLSTGQLKVFDDLHAWFEEFRIYRRDEKGRVVKQNDHLMDCTRYRVLAGIGRMKRVPIPEGPDDAILPMHPGDRGSAWMGL